MVKDAPKVEKAVEGSTKGAEQNGETGPVYTGKTAKIGRHAYPSGWGPELMPTFVMTGICDIFHLDGVLQKLALPQETRPEAVIDALNKYLDGKENGQLVGRLAQE